MLMDPKEDPLFQHFPQFLPTCFQRRCLGVNTLACWNFTIIAALIRQNFIFCLAERRLNVFEEHSQTFNLPLTRPAPCRRNLKIALIF